MEEAFRTVLLANAGVSAIVEDRASWRRRNSGEPAPALVFHMISAPRGYTMSEQTTLREALIQVDCWGGTYLEAKTLARAVEAALPDLSGGEGFQRAFIETERDDDEAPAGPDAAGRPDLFRTSLDIRVWRQPA